MEKLFKSLVFVAFLVTVLSCRGNGTRVENSDPQVESVVLKFQAQANGTLKAFVENVEKQTGNKIAKGSLVKFVATANKDYEVNEWTGGVQVDATDRTKASIKADSDVNVTVSFREKQSGPKEEVVLKFQAQANGTVKAFVENVEKQTGNKIPKGSLVKFVATANKDYEVNEWTGGVQVDATDRTKASIKADSDVNVTVSFREKQSEPKEVEITKVIISNKEWDASTKTITMPKDYTSFAKDNVKVWGRAKDSKDVFEELEVDSISQDPVEPTQEGVEVTITTKTNAKFKAGSVKVIVKKLGAKENIILTKIIIKEKEADMLSNLVFFDHPVPKITKDDVKVEGKAFGDVISTPLEIESIDPVEVTVPPLGSIFTIKTKETEKYNATSHNITVVRKYSGVELECIKLKYAWDSYYKSKVEDGISVITVNSRDKDKEFTVNDIKVEFGGLDKGLFNVDSIIPDKIKPSNEGFGAKCIVIVRGTYGSISVLEIPFYIRHR